MSRSGFVSLLVIVSLCAAAGIGSPVTAYEHGGATVGAVDATNGGTASTDFAHSMSSTQQFDRTLFIVTVYENGSATWTFRYERTLDGGSDEVEAFEDFAEEFESEETALYQRVTEQARGLTETGAERTSREMEATNFNRSAGVEHRIRQEGVVEISFLWEAFAELDQDERIVVGDAFDGFPLESNQQLIIEAGDGLAFVSAQPDGEYATLSIEDADSITWLGGQEFIAGQPRVVLEHEADEGMWSSVPTDPAVFVIATLLLASLVLAGALAWRRTGSPESDASHASSGGAAEPIGGTEPADDTEPLSEDELLTDEDRVVKLIRENGGRMKQVHIVEETGWSKSKVSMLLSEMESENTISKLRVGRENIISLDGFEPEATKSPFEE